MMSWQTAPYDEYKDTEYDWLGRVPSHWEKTSIRSISKLSNQRYGKRDDLELLSVYREYGVIRKASRDDNHNVESEDLSNYKYVDKGYLVLNKMKMWQGSLGVSNYEGIVSPAYIVCQLSQGLNKHYVNYLLRAAVFKTIYNRLSYGVRVGQWDMRYEDFKNIILYIPPKEEQDQIVRFLDDKISKVNRLIRAKRKQIALLKEQKQVVINHIVTNGLDLHAGKMPFNIEGLGDVPRNWSVKPLKYFVKSNIETLTNSFDGNKIINYLDISTVGFGELKQKPVRHFFKEAPSRARRVIRTGDTIISTVRTYLKSMCYVSEDLDGFIASTGFAVLTPSSSEVHPRLLSYVLSADYFLSSVSKSSTGVSYPAISDSKLLALKIALPSDLNEQREMEAQIQEKTQKFDIAISRLNKEVELLIEYRTTLISDVVTGKVDVRGIEIEEPVHFEEDLDELDEGELENLEIDEGGEEE